MLVGGMSQAVNKYLEANNVRFADEIKRNNLGLHISDINILYIKLEIKSFRFIRCDLYCINMY